MMAATQLSLPRPGFWKTVLTYGALHFLVMSFGAFVLEPFSGGCMFVIPAYFMALVVVIPVLMLRRFGAGTAVFLPYAVLGFYPTYYFEWLTSQSLIGFWGVVGWCLIGPLVGLIADLTFKYLPQAVPKKRRAVVVGMTVGAAIFLTTFLALQFFYREPDLSSHYRFFTTGIYFSLPWLIVNGGFAGYTAYALTHRV